MYSIMSSEEAPPEATLSVHPIFVTVFLSTDPSA